MALKILRTAIKLQFVTVKLPFLLLGLFSTIAFLLFVFVAGGTAVAGVAVVAAAVVVVAAIVDGVECIILVLASISSEESPPDGSFVICQKLLTN